MNAQLEADNREAPTSRGDPRLAGGVVGQGVRFVVAGSVVALVYTGTTLILSGVVGVPFQVALLIGYCTALLLHFTLQRVFVWTHHEEFALPVHHQAARYLLVAAAQYGVTALSTAVLPSLLGLPTEVVYLATFAIIVSGNFLVFRHGIFHPQETSAGGV
jgi:putative flippase GtrA